MTHVTEMESAHLPKVMELVNSHVDTMIPGWCLTSDFVLSRLESNPKEIITDPWVAEGRTIVGIQGDRVRAGAHLLR